ncbi:hypothetical protein Ocin01_06367 [Orchesella cincta]|uniref:DUF4789 domain-containing protein n=1 Tax=Orchesella cincta TaxID=48709 RepID=A0A1D2N5H6_ORCCI|nr:hypothetical protein Ocin01_06367 [Orchesella cincta]
MISKATVSIFFIVIVLIIKAFAETNSTSKSQVISERIITNLKDVINGVPIDYSYNESDTIPPAGLISVPGCPKSDEGYPWLYFGSPPKCFLTGQRGPCPADQSLFVELRTPFGFCNCDCFEGTQSSVKATPDQDRFCTALLQEFVYMPALEKCFPIFDQGPCAENEWLVKVAENVNGTNAFAKCETRKCPPGQAPVGEDKDGKTSCFGRFSVYASPVSIPRNKCKSEGMGVPSLQTDELFTMAQLGTGTLITIFVILTFQSFTEAKSVVSEPTLVNERIITDFNYVFDGAEVDFRYNESGSRMVSAPGCPKSDAGYPWVYYGSPKKCYLAGQPNNQCQADESLFVKSESPSWGFCNCNCFEGENGIRNKEQDQFCMGRNMEFVFMSKLGKCYVIYEQGPCGEEEWLVKIVNGTKEFAQCEKRKCPVGEIIYAENDEGKSNCGPRYAIAAGVAVSIQRNQCESDGMKYSELLQKCVTPFSTPF